MTRRTHKTKLSRQMTVAQFQNGYWYTPELRRFAQSCRIPHASKLRKDELEAAVVELLRSGKMSEPARKIANDAVAADSEKGLRPGLRIVRFRNDPVTWNFIEREARKLVPEMKRRTGAKYRLNRWRESQIAEGNRITYRDLITEYVRLSAPATQFAPVPQVRYVNFVRDYFANESGATWKGMLRAWAEVKKLDAPKDYRSWKASRN
jgi:hypothetical protein